MYCRSVVVLLSLFAAVVTSQDNQACTDAQNALLANQPCFNALSGVRNAIDVNSNITLGDGGVDLNVYCAADCRNLVNQQAMACDVGDDSIGAAAFLGLTQFICTTDTDNNVNCLDFIDSPQFEALNNDFTESGVCPDEIPAGQMCSSACQTALQNFVIDSGCCINMLLGALRLDPDAMINGLLLSQCPVDISQDHGTCIEIGAGETGAGETGAGETEAGETGAGETGAGETGAGETGAGETGAGETGTGGGATGLKAFGGVLLFAVITAVTVPGYS